MLTIFEPLFKTTVQENTFFAAHWQDDITKTKNSWISDTVENHWQIKKFKSWLWWKLPTLRRWHWRALFNPWYHHLLQNSNMLSATIIIITAINIIIFRTRTCCPPFSAWSKRSMLQVWRSWSWPPGYKSFLRETNIFKSFFPFKRDEYI